MGRLLTAVFAVVGSASLVISCASGDDSTTDNIPAPSGGKGGSAGKGGSGGGSAGTSSTAGAAGSSAGNNQGGNAGDSQGGNAGDGQGGDAGDGQGGDAGSGTAGDAGSGQGGDGQGGDAGSGTAGDAGSGQGGDSGASGSGPNCQPEICNGLDDDCDGEKDEDIPGTGEPCTVPNKQGECAFGTTQCAKGKFECVQNVGASPEVCDGKDNNCDGQIDNAPTDVGSQCFTDQKGLCAQGTMKCTDGEAKCVSNFTPTEESCNGFDDNCDGNVDEGFPGSGQPCQVAGLQGPCAQGQTTCQNAGNSCVQVVFPQGEICDGIDNDCDGQIDEAEDVTGKPCDTGQLGECASGKTQCANGQPSCLANVQASPETCDGKDNDCNGQIDDMSATKLKTQCTKDFPGGSNVQDWVCELGECVIGACSGNFTDCDGSPANGCEVDKSSNVNNCGGCGASCPAINGTPTCVASQCGIVCNAGFGNCDGVVGNGCEQSLNNDPANCGICSKACSNDGGSGLCNGGTCKTECNAGRADCDNIANNGCEVFTSNDPKNCGGCGKVCSAANATPTCESGVCVPVCKAGFADCDGDPANGCEVNLKTNPNNCGSCDNVCNNVNGSASCSNGNCGLSCFPGFGDCDLNAGNGCEINTSTNVANCGQCGKACSNNNGTPSCTLGVCSISCSAGFANCDGQIDNGCETDKNTDINNCGGCGIKCNSTNGNAVCDNGTCKISSCNAGFANCDGLASNGCETNTNTDTNNCGTCSNKCSSSGGGASCNGGSCGITCNPGLADCDGSAGNGCEVTLATNINNCGSCGNNCSTLNASGTACAVGKCNPSCNAGFGDCDGLGPNGCETNTNTSVNNCGGCGIKCVTTNANGATCSAGACNFQCKPGFADCDNNPANGCETNIASDDNNCGVCGNKCAFSNGVGSCQAGACTVTGCSAPFANCDGNSNNGCETNTSTSVDNCGGCGTACSTNNSTPVCTSGACGVGSCNSGFANCDGNPNNGCEINTNTNNNNCGGCGNVCTNTANATAMTCSGGGCNVATCATDFFDTDGNGANGCECKQDTVPNTCAGAVSLGTFATGAANQNFTFNLTGNSDEDWFKVTFTKAASCSYSPSIFVAAGSLPIKIQVFNSCGSTGLSCNGSGESGTSAPAAGIVRWDWNFNKTCQINAGNNTYANPAKPINEFIQTDETYYIRVIKTGADATNSCLGYTLTIGNNAT